MSAPPPSRFDLVLRRGLVIDGTGAAAVRADVGIRDGKIVAVGDLESASASVVRDCAGRVIAPGFIDIHTHSDFSVLFTPQMESSLAQGVTAEVFGNCGISLGLASPDDAFALERRGLERVGLPLDWSGMREFLGRIESQGIAIHVATLAGHGTLRKRTLGLERRAPDPAELARMQSDLADALDAGAVGLSSGLEYVPGMYADVAEMTALAKVAAEAGGFYATHLRDEGDYLEESVAEAIAVAEGAGCPLQLSHHKAEKPQNWGKVRRTLATVDAARARGLDILLDQYPYTAYQTALATIALPPWAVGGTPLALARTLRNPDTRAQVRAQMTALDWRLVDMASCPHHREYQGHSIAALAESAGKDPETWVLDLLAEGDGWVSAVHYAMDEADVEFVLRDPHVMIGSDSVATALDGPTAQERPHPRSFGTFARILGRYVREKHTLALPEAIRRMTGLPASRLGWSDRGRIAEGCAADLVVLNPESVADTATFARPHALAAGIDAVYVGGTLAWESGAPTGARPGKVLRRGG